MTGSYPKIEVLTGPERRRRWSVAEKLEIVAQTREAGVTVSLVARRCGVSPNQLFTWRRLAEQGALTATAAEEEVVPASAFRAQQEQIRELQRLLGKKTLEVECQTARKVAPRSASNVDPLSMLRGEEAARRSWSGLRSRADSGSVVCGELRACS